MVDAGPNPSWELCAEPPLPNPRVLLSVLTLLVLVLTLPSQRGVRTLTTTGRSHSIPKLSPNGNWVAFRTTNAGVAALGISHTDPGSKESILYTGILLTKFFWHPDSRGLFYMRGTVIEYIRTVGGVPLAVGTIGGNSPTMHGIDPTGKYLFGVSRDVNFTYQIWRLNTDGNTNPTTIHTVKFNFLDSLVMDSSGQKIAYTSQPAGAPFAPVDIRRIDADGKHDISMTQGPIPDILRLLAVSRPKDLTWVDQGKTLLFTAADRQAAPWQVYRISEKDPDPLLMTDTNFFHTNPLVRGDWVVYRATIRHQSQTPHDHSIIGLMPTSGGGRVPLEPELDWVINGAPTMDDGNQKIAFAAYAKSAPPGSRPEIQLIYLDREVRTYPRATLGKTLNFELPVALNERGTLFLSTSILELDPKKQLSIPGLVYRVALHPAVILPLLSGIGSGTAPLKVSVTIPLDQSLIGLEVYLQGLRVKPGTPLKGDLTRFVKLRFFDYRL